MNKKGQGALEYLLLIGGAILVAVVVITILSGLGNPVGAQANETAARAICSARTTNPETACAGTPAQVGDTPNKMTCTCAVNTGRCEATNCVRS